MVTVQRSVRLPTDLAGAWRMMTDDQRLSEWLGQDVSLDPRPGGQVSLTDWDGTPRLGEVDDVDPPHRLTLTWWPRRPFGLPLRSQVKFTLHPVDGGVLLEVHEHRTEPAAVTAGFLLPERKGTRRGEASAIVGSAR